MRRFLSLLILSFGLALAQAQSPSVLTNETIFRMVQAGVPSDVIIRTIAAAEQVVVGTRRGGTLVYALVPTAAAVAEVRLGVGALPNMVVILGAERGRLISGYQYSDESKLSIPGDALWLR